MEKNEFSEAEFQSLIEFILIDEFSKHTPFEILYHSGTDENKKGYDMEVRSLVPLFFQFKVAKFYPIFTRSEMTKLRRENLGYKDNPGHFTYRLHIDKKTNTYLQHNLLYELGTNGNYARYVVPLFYKRSTLNKYKYNRPEVSWNFSPHFLMDGIDYYDWRDYLNFPHSVTIRPHKLISGSDGHYYCYNHRGEVSFHSDPEKVEQKNYSLAEYLRYTMRQSMNGEGIRFKNILLSIAKSIVRTNEQYLKSEDKIIGLKTSIKELMQLPEKVDEMDFTQKLDIFDKMTTYLFKEHNISTILGAIEW